MSVLSPPVTVTEQRPRYEGANIRTWIGFKHFMYLVEEAVLDWLRVHTPGARRLYHDSGLGVEIVDCSVQLPTTLEVDDLVRARVTSTRPGLFTVTLHAVRAGGEVLALRGKVTVALIREADAPAAGPIASGADLLPEPTAQLAVAAEPGPADAFGWSWRAPYYYCHFSDRVQHSGYVRVLEEAVDRFLDHRGIPVGRLVRERGWIPVVSRARVRMLAPAHMDEIVHTTFAVTDVLRDTLFDGRMDSYVDRAGVRVHVATAGILHGYAVSRGPDAGRPATLDAGVVRALLGDAS